MRLRHHADADGRLLRPVGECGLSGAGPTRADLCECWHGECLSVVEGNPALRLGHVRLLIGLRDGRKTDQDSTAAAILLHSAEGRDVELGADFTHKLGKQLLETENGDPLRYSQINNGVYFGGESYADENGDPLRQFVKVADNGIGSAQAVMGDQDMAKYLMHDRLTANHLADDMDSVVRAATVDAAMEPGDTGKNAAEIASWTVKYAAETDLEDAYDEELGGIVGTYIADTFAAVDDGSYPPIDPPVPPHHANFNKADLETVLNKVGGNDTATSIIGQQTSKLNQLVIDEYTQQSLDGRASGDKSWHADTDGDPLKIGLNRAAGVRGFIEDELSQGMIDDGKEAHPNRGCRSWGLKPPVSSRLRAM